MLVNIFGTRNTSPSRLNIRSFRRASFAVFCSYQRYSMFDNNLASSSFTRVIVSSSLSPSYIRPRFSGCSCLWSLFPRLHPLLLLYIPFFSSFLSYLEEQAVLISLCTCTLRDQHGFLIPNSSSLLFYSKRDIQLYCSLIFHKINFL